VVTAEDRLALRRRYGRAVIADGELECAVGEPGDDRDPTASRRIADRVIEQVLDHACEQIGVELRFEIRRHRDLDPQFADLRVGERRRPRILDDRGQRGGLRRRPQHAVLELIDVEDRRHQRQRLHQELPGVVEESGQALRAGREQLGPDQVEVADRTRQRAAQVVDDQRREHALLAAQLLILRQQRCGTT
jgi:hypothetical protein